MRRNGAEKEEYRRRTQRGHQARSRIRVQARRNRLLGLWLAEMFGLKGDEATAYAAEVSPPTWMNPATKT